jgi:hypothetical protein
MGSWAFERKRGNAVAKPVTAEEQEALFQAIIRKIPSIEDPAKLQEVAELALALMLRRPADTELRDELRQEIHDAIAEVKPGRSADAMRNEMRFAARACIKVLQAAKERRLPRHLQQGGGWAQAKEPQAFHAIHHESQDDRETRKTTRYVVAGAVLVIAAGAYAWWSGSRTADPATSTEAGKFAQQVMDAVRGGGPANHLFGGSLKLVFMGEHPVVVAEGVPPRICAASGWMLVKSGILTINGVTPTRVSAGRITELCNQEEGDATVMWSPK